MIKVSNITAKIQSNFLYVRPVFYVNLYIGTWAIFYEIDKHVH